AQRIIEVIRARGYRSVLSLGIGHQVLPTSIIRQLGAVLEQYSIIEGSREIIANFRSKTQVPANTALIHSFFEEDRPAKNVEPMEWGFVLGLGNYPAVIVRQYTEYLGPNGRFFIAVPNARSLHRLIGHEAGLLDNLYRLSAEDLQLGHQRYFDFTSLCK